MGYGVSVSVSFVGIDEYIRFLKLLEDNKKSGNLPTAEVSPEGRLVCQNQWRGGGEE